MIIYRFKMMLSGVRLENHFKVFGQNMSIKNLNSMPSEARQFFLFYLSVKRCNLGLSM